jgi:hypothetical protein
MPPHRSHQCKRRSKVQSRVPWGRHRRRHRQAGLPTTDGPTQRPGKRPQEIPLGAFLGRRARATPGAPAAKTHPRASQCASPPLPRGVAREAGRLKRPVNAGDLVTPSLMVAPLQRLLSTPEIFRSALTPAALRWARTPRNLRTLCGHNFEADSISPSDLTTN